MGGREEEGGKVGGKSHDGKAENIEKKSVKIFFTSQVRLVCNLHESVINH